MSVAPMVSIKWQINPATGNYDIVNQFQKNSLEVIKSKILIRLNTSKGEWAPDPDFGISSSILSQNQNDPDIQTQLILDEILKVKNVNSATVSGTNFDASNRLLSASFNVNTVYGQINVTRVF